MTNSAHSGRAPTVPRAHSFLLLLVAGVGFRLLQFFLLSDQVLQAALLNHDILSLGHYLPEALWRENFSAAILYLQQTPPLPALIFGIATRATSDTVSLVRALILLCGLLDSLTAVLMAILLARLDAPKWVMFALPLIFLANADTVLLDYFTFGEYFYEHLTMLGIMTSSLLALSLSKNPSCKNAFLFGTTIALLALTRATFSYFAIVALVWLITAVRLNRRPALLLYFALPIALLQGGWAMKQLLVQGEWQWATSSWGGANIQSGIIRRGLPDRLNNRAATFSAIYHEQAAQVSCLQNWRYLWDLPSVFLMFPEVYTDASLQSGVGPSEAARRIDTQVEQARGLHVKTDSAGFREYSQCMQKTWLRYWVKNPRSAIKSVWMSYAKFWSSIASISEVYPTVLLPAKAWLNVDGNRTNWAPQGDWLSLPRYLVRKNRYVLFGGDRSEFEPTIVLVLPVLPGLVALIAMIMLHIATLGAIGSLFIRQWRHLYPVETTSYLLVTFFYLAALSSIAEFGENMRFRLPVEPVVWIVAVILLKAIFVALKNGRHRHPVHSEVSK